MLAWFIQLVWGAANGDEREFANAEKRVAVAFEPR
jgi:hypothetical protein